MMNDLEKMRADIAAEVNKQIRIFGVNLFTKISFRTPVDQGTARANWLVSFGSPVNIKSESTNYAANDQEQVGRLNRYEGIGTPIFLQNNMPYIERLENGWSPQRAPGEMVALSITEMTRGGGGR